MTDLNPESVIHRVGEQVSTQVEDKIVLLQLSSGKYYALNQVGALLWQHLEAPCSIQSLAEHVVAEYEVDYKVALHDALALLQKLKDAGFIDTQAPTPEVLPPS